MRLFGIDNREPIQELFIHIGALLAALFACKSMLQRIRREKKAALHGRRRRAYTSKGFYDLQLIKTAAVPLMIILLLYIAARKWESNLLLLALFLLINGIILIIPEYSRQGNKDSRSMTGIDSILIGIFGGISAIPGISRIGSISAYATFRGADRQHTLNWALLLSIPALLVLCGLDVSQLFFVKASPLSFTVVFGYILSALSSYFASYLSIIFIRFLTVRTGYVGFAYYSWGMALFTLIIYLIA